MSSPTAGQLIPRLDTSSLRSVWSELFVWCSAALVALLLGQAHALAQTDTRDLTAIGTDDSSDVVLVIPVHGTIEPGLAAFVRRAVDDAEAQDADAILLDVDTFGGRVDAAVQIRDAVLTTNIPVVAYINRRAISAGALISLAADQLVFAPGATMGAATPIEVQGGEATPVDEKMTSYMRAEMRATAEASGRDAKLAEAMVDAKLVVDGVVDDTTLLTVSSEEALSLGLADGMAPTQEALLSALRLGAADVRSTTPSWSEALARIVTEPTLAGILMSIGMLALLLELYSPGLGWSGLLGMTCLGLVFGGHLLADLAGWEEVLLLSAGLIALAAEVFVIPGFGIAGVTGIVLVFAALVLTLIGLPVDVAWDVGLLWEAIMRVTITLGMTLLGMMVLVRFFPRRALPSGIVLDTNLGTASFDGDNASGQSTPDSRALVGLTGTATTRLRPSGKVQLHGDGAPDLPVDVVAESGWLPEGAPVRVVRVDGVKVVVAAQIEAVS